MARGRNIRLPAPYLKRVWLDKARVPDAASYPFCLLRGTTRQALFLFDEPESALASSRQVEFLKLVKRMDESGIVQVVMATHSPMLMAYPNARLLRLTKYGLSPVTLEETEHYRLWREFCTDPEGFVQGVFEG
jgi:predicted ATPase